MKQITESQLVLLLAQTKGARPVTVSAFTKPAQRKTGNPYQSIRKFSVVNGMTGVDYEKAVGRQEVREGAVEATFEAQSRQWGEHVSNVLVEQKGKWYISIIVKRVTKVTRYYGEETGGRMVRITGDVAKKFLSPHTEPAGQPVEKKIVFRNYAIANIRLIAIDGERYRLIHPAS